MNTIKRVVFWTSLVYLGIWIIFPIIRKLFHLEFVSNEMKVDYQKFQFYAVPVAILLTLVWTIKPKDLIKEKLYKVSLTLLVIVFLYFITIMTLFMGMCIYTDREVLYQHKENPNRKIMIRNYGCGAFDSSTPSTHVFEVNYFSRYIKSAHKIDTTEIEMWEWERVK